MATHASILPWRIGQRSLVGYSPWSYKELDTTEQLTFSFSPWHSTYKKWGCCYSKSNENSPTNSTPAVNYRLSNQQLIKVSLFWGFPGGTSGKEPTCQYRRPKHRFDPWVRKTRWTRAWQPTAVFLPGEYHGQRTLVDYSPWGCKELDTTEWLTYHCFQFTSQSGSKA